MSLDRRHHTDISYFKEILGLPDALDLSPFGFLSSSAEIMTRSTPSPFPTVALLAKECKETWSAFENAAEATAIGETRLQSALSDPQFGRNILGSDSSLVLFGSFARREMTCVSDYDWTLLIDGVVDNQHADEARKIHAALAKAKLIEPGSSGTFGNIVFSHDLVHRIGGGADSNANLTRRMLMLLESRPVDFAGSASARLVWNNVISNILERYFEQDVHFSPVGKCRVPRFLLNDLTRYWRTICVDYAAKHREQDGKKWALRNAKLRLSRKLIYASGLAFCLSCELDPPREDAGLFGKRDARDAKPFIEAARRFSETPSLDYIASFIKAFVSDEARRVRIAKLIFGSYNQWLELVADEEFRNKLDKLNHIDAAQCDTFQEIRKLGTDFSKGLKLLFFCREDDSDPISKLCLDYVGF